MICSAGGRDDKPDQPISVEEIKAAIERLGAKDRSMLLPWLLVKFDVQGRSERHAHTEVQQAPRQLVDAIVAQSGPVDEANVNELEWLFRDEQPENGIVRFRKAFRAVAGLLMLIFGNKAAREALFERDARERREAALRRYMNEAVKYAHIEASDHPWRKGMKIKGRRLTVAQLIGRMSSNSWSVDETADEYDLPRDAVAEALDYAKRFPEVVADDAAGERRRALDHKRS